MNIIQQIVEYVKDEEYIYIQTHNFPDHDSVASAVGLQYLLQQFGVNSHLIYEGDIQRDSLVEMIDTLEIDIQHNENHELEEDHMIVIVDGCKGNKNVTDLIGDEIAVIDHHNVIATEDVRFTDIRPEYGACSSLIYDLYKEMEIEVPRNIATALMIGINMDTNLLTRNASQMDVQAYADLYPLMDMTAHNSLLRNFIQTKDLEFYKYAIEHTRIQEEISFCYFSEGCNQNLLGILGDFFLALKEVDFVILCARNGNIINFSLRNERPEWNASLVIQDVLREIGFGGGHMDMAGGIIKDPSLFNEEVIFQKFLERLRADLK
ncbi:MAG: recombinase RecJ [bacterium]|nr:recombinase RecJ [bacterium]